MKKLSIGAAFVAIFYLLEASLISGVEKIDVNTAPLEDLVKIVHIGEARARELISLRPFTSVNDLTRIKGIGESRIKDIKQQGLAWVDPLLNVGGEASNIFEAPPLTSETQIIKTKDETEDITPLKTEPQTDKNNSGKELAATGEYLPQIKGFSLIVLLMALALAVFSGAIILTLKKGLK